MASQALYRRYRSQTFDELIGQEHIVQTLRNAMAEGRIAHAYLFTGPRGVGKTTVARLLAKAVNCLAEVGQRPCGACVSCTAIAEGRAVDVIEMDAASHTSVEDAREIIERVQFRPTSGAFKVYIIDEVHMLSTAAFNALLKTLEEPPGHALFVLATTESHKVPATILSRCQRFTFNRHTVAATATHLHDIAAAEQISLEPGVAEAIARAATGSMRDALSVLDQLMAYGGGTIRLEQVRGLLGATEAQEVAALVDALIGGDLSGALHAVNGVATQGADLRQFSRDLVERLRAVMLLKAGGDPALLDVTTEDLAALEAQSAAGDLASFLGWVKLFSGLDFQLRTSAYGQLPLELAVVEAIAVLAPAAAQAPARAAAPPQRQPQRPAASPPTPARPPAVQPPSTPDRASAVSAPLPPVAPIPAPVPDEPPHPAFADAAPASAQPAPTPAASAPAPSLDEPPSLAFDHAEPTDVPGHVPVAETPAPPPAPEEIVVQSGAAAFVADTESGDGVAQANADVALLEQVEGIWEEVLQGIRARDKTLYVLLTSNGGVKPIDVKETQIIFEVKTDWQAKRIQESKARRLIETVLSKYMRANYAISCVAEAQHRENANELREQIRNSRQDPHVKAAINIFDADIIAVEQKKESNS